MAADPGNKAVDMFRTVGTGKIKALWVIPALTMPDAEAVRAAIEGCDVVAVSDITGATGTVRLADVMPPATAWAGKDGTVTNSDHAISRQWAMLPIPGVARPEWQILAQMGQRLGWHGDFDYRLPRRDLPRIRRPLGHRGQAGA
ncbi:hypothetical protein GCM10011415_24190 [Salipiger pallidus]|uniref:Molybdopterin oxidoreductase domain-containing protein n=1 Tax=Salipiger pallidus TaxID=1775170 RepID=A0A8J3EGP9_9RHOB|nr:molybdopterin-dependent oxidoreductase [Salipiger pallidus]GGG74834.1 hypothetical protein GCM10011415_24190 [Salipiger pallidus]